MEDTNKIVRLEEQMKAVGGKIDSLDEKMEKGFEDLKTEMKCFVRREEFMPYKRALDIAFGVAITAIIGGILAIILK